MEVIFSKDAINIKLEAIQEIPPQPMIMPIHDQKNYLCHLYIQEPNGNLKIFILSRVFKAIWRHAQSNVTRELGGVLVGRYCREAKALFVMIEGFIRASHTEADDISLKFTDETWSAINSELNEYYEGKIIVGWYHTHPNWGIFLSQEDLFISKHFFTPWQVALVLDPIKYLVGFFMLYEDQLIQCKDFYFYDLLQHEKALDEAVNLMRRK